MNPTLAYFRRLLKKIDTQTSTGSSGGNPTGGSVDLARVNYSASLLAQWIMLESGSTSAVVMNLLSSLIEPFNLYASTLFYKKILSINPLARFDNVVGYVAGTTSILPGFMNPATLRLSTHFNGTGNIPSAVVSSDIPLYNSGLHPAAHFNFNNNVTSTSPNFSLSQFVGGVPSSFSGAASIVFDHNLNTSITPATASVNFYSKYDLGIGNEKILKSFFIKATIGSSATDTIIISGSNNDTDWTEITTTTISGIDSTRFLSSDNIVAYRYYKWTVTGVGAVTPFEFTGLLTPYSQLFYDTDVKYFGSSSAKFTGLTYLKGSASSVSELYLSNLNWHMSGFFRFDVAPTNMTLFSISGLQLEIKAVSNNLQVRYSTNGSTFTDVESSNIAWQTGVFYYISIKRVNNTLYFYIDNVPYGTADLTGVIFFNTVSLYYQLGCDNSGINLFIGNVDEFEFLINDYKSDIVPVEPRTTAYIPAIDVETISSYIPSDISVIDVLFFCDEVSFYPTMLSSINTELIFSISIDNGATFHPVSLEKTGTLTTNTMMYRGTINVVSLTNTNQLKYKIANVAGKVIKFDGAIITWS